MKLDYSIRTQYLERLYGPKFFKLVPKAVKQLTALKKQLKFDALAFSGNSGAGFGFPLSYLMKMPVINVRHATEHCSLTLEGTISSSRYLIIDDCIESGKTIRRIKRVIKDELGKDTIPVCIFLYDSDPWFGPCQKLPVFVLEK